MRFPRELRRRASIDPMCEWSSGHIGNQVQECRMVLDLERVPV